jgi:hypothetical protein
LLVKEEVVADRPAQGVPQAGADAAPARDVPAGFLEVPVTDQYKDLGCWVQLDASGRVSYQTHIDQVVRESTRHRGLLASNGVYQLPPAAVGLAYMSLLQPSLTYAMGVWGIDRRDIPELARAYVSVQHGATRAAHIPHAVADCITGMRPLAHTRDTLILQLLVYVCSRPRNCRLRGLITKELVDWEVATTKGARTQLWINGALAVADDVDTALKWNLRPVRCVLGKGARAGRPDTVEPQWYGEGLEPDDLQPIHEYRQTVVRVLKHWVGGAQGGPLPLQEDRDLVRRLEVFRYDGMQVLRFKRQVCAIWELRSQLGLAHLNISRRPPPYAWLHRSTANDLRSLARAGVYAFLRWQDYQHIRGEVVGWWEPPGDRRAPLPPNGGRSGGRGGTQPEQR